MKKNIANEKAALDALQKAFDVLSVLDMDERKAIKSIHNAVWQIVLGLLPEDVQNLADKDGCIRVNVPVRDYDELSLDEKQYEEASAAQEMQNDLFHLVYTALGYTNANDKVPGSNVFVDALQAVSYEIEGRVYAVCVPA